MMLVDSSVWIDAVQGRRTAAIILVDQRDADEEIATAGVILQEVLQGAKDEANYERLRDVLWSLLILQPREMLTYELAAQLHAKSRRKGLSIRRPTHCLVAALALEHEALLVHNDSDFVSIAKAEPTLNIYPERGR